MKQLRECVFIDGVRTANARAHKDKGWFRDLRPDELLTEVYSALFKRNPQIKPDDLDAVLIGCASISGMQYELGRISWLASGMPESVPTVTLSNQCPSGMTATMMGARAIMTGEADIILAGGAEDMDKGSVDPTPYLAPRLFERYNPFELPMGATAEKVAEQFDISVDDMVNFAWWSHTNASRAHAEGKFKNELIPVKGKKDDGTEFMVDRDQWVRDGVDKEQMKAMKTPFKENGRVSAATSSPITAGACGLIIMSREKADRLGLPYAYKYSFGAQAGNDPTVMGVGPIYAVKKLFEKTGLSPKDIGPIEINEAFASQSLACIRELGLDKPNAPFDRINVWGGATALGHPLGQSGARILITLLNIMKTEFPDAKYGMATLCGGLGNANAMLVEKV